MSEDFFYTCKTHWYLYYLLDILCAKSRTIWNVCPKAKLIWVLCGTYLVFLARLEQCIGHAACMKAANRPCSRAAVVCAGTTGESGEMNSWWPDEIFWAHACQEVLPRHESDGRDSLSSFSSCRWSARAPASPTVPRQIQVGCHHASPGPTYFFGGVGWGSSVGRWRIYSWLLKKVMFDTCLSLGSQCIRFQMISLSTWAKTLATYSPFWCHVVLFQPIFWDLCYCSCLEWWHQHGLIFSNGGVFVLGLVFCRL